MFQLAVIVVIAVICALLSLDDHLFRAILAGAPPSARIRPMPTTIWQHCLAEHFFFVLLCWNMARKKGLPRRTWPTPHTFVMLNIMRSSIWFTSFRMKKHFSFQLFVLLAVPFKYAAFRPVYVVIIKLSALSTLKR